MSISTSIQCSIMNFKAASQPTNLASPGSPPKEGAWYVFQNWSWFRFCPRKEKKWFPRCLPAVWRRFVFVPLFGSPIPI